MKFVSTVIALASSISMVYGDHHRCVDQLPDRCGINLNRFPAGFFGGGRECPDSGCTPEWCCSSYCSQTFGSITPSASLTNACKSGEFINPYTVCPTFPCTFEFCCGDETGTGDMGGTGFE